MDNQSFIFQISQFLSFIGPVALLGAFASFIITKKQANDAERVNDRQWLAIDHAKELFDQMEKDVSQTRLELELKIAKLDGNFAQLSTKLDNIVEKLDSLIKELKK
jgi:hypothetical protein